MRRTASSDKTEALLARGLSARTPKTIVNETEFRTELARTRDRGIAISDQEARANLSCVAIALLDNAGQPAAALAISGPSHGFDFRRNAALLRSVAAEAERLIRYARHSARRRGGYSDRPRPFR